MFPILPIFLIFVLVVNYYIRKQGHTQEDIERQFWEREQKANNTRKQDISKLDYINIPLEKIPQNLNTDAEKELIGLSSRKLLNLTGLTNTDLKLQYGVANLEELSQYDDNFSQFVSVLPVYAKELIDSGQISPAKELLEFAVSTGADSRAIYTMLAELYRDAGEEDKIEALIASAEKIDSISGQVIVKALKE